MKKAISFYITCSLFFCACAKGQVVKEFSISTLTDVGMREATMNKMTDALRNQKYTNVHSVLISKNNKLVYEQYFTGKDQTWAEGDVGIVHFTKDSLHDARSISKSIISACIGIAIQQGLIKNVEQQISKFFPEYDSLLIGAKKTITIKELLTMSDGLEWNENIIYSDTMNSEIQLYNSCDPIAYILSRNLSHTPGENGIIIVEA